MVCTLRLPDRVRITQGHVIGFQFVDVGVIGGRRNGEQQQRPVLVGVGVFGEGNAVGEFVQFAHVAHQLIVGYVPLPYLIAQKLPGCWNFRVVGDGLGQVIRVGNLCA